ncbi:hypothetical protein PG984_011785 [Apiospora sp. TS-2023a]
MRQLQHPVNHLDEEYSGVSPRTPNVDHENSNQANNVRMHLRADGHRVWGFVLYRCTYASDTDWESCIQRIHASVRENMDYYNGQDLIEEGCFQLTVISDASTLDGASTHTVRQHFNEWCGRMVQEEQGPPEETQRRKQKPPTWFTDWEVPVRYNFCIQVDEDSLRSFDSEWNPWVKLIKRDWKPREKEPSQFVPGPGWIMEIRGRYNDVEYDEFHTEEDDEEYPPIEGCTDEDVGWAKVRLLGLMPAMYVKLRNPNIWSIQYYRPPDLPEF